VLGVAVHVERSNSDLQAVSIYCLKGDSSVGIVTACIRRSVAAPTPPSRTSGPARGAAISYLVITGGNAAGT
jgi:hypothetical protein